MRTKSGIIPMAGHSTLVVCPSFWLRWLASSPSISTLRRTRSCVAALAQTSSRARHTPCCVCPAIASDGAPVPAHAPLTHHAHRRPHLLELPRPSACRHLHHHSLWPLCPTPTTPATVGVEEVVTSPCTPCQGTPS